MSETKATMAQDAGQQWLRDDIAHLRASRRAAIARYRRDSYAMASATRSTEVVIFARAISERIYQLRTMLAQE